MQITELSQIKDEILSLWNSGDFESQRELSRHIVNMYGDFGGRKTDSIRRTISKWIYKANIDDELVEQNVKLAKQKQKQQDTNRIERKSFREYARVENAVSVYGEALVKELQKYGSKINPSDFDNGIGIVNGGTGVIQITDLHANELIDLPHNKYNFDVLSKRLHKQIRESIAYFKFRGIEKVLIAFTGDLLNSDRRLDELLNQATNRSKASVLAAHILTQAILHVRKHYSQVDIVSVLGNESRVNKEMTFSNEAFSDNYDFTIISMCKIAIEASKLKGVNFLSIDKMETIVNFGDQSWLVAHDVTKMTDKQEKTQSSIGRYHLSGKPIDYIIGGHIHAHRATDISCRSGSLAGSNTYNEYALNLQGHASAVCYVVKGKERFYQYIDCQSYTDEGYNYIEELEAYNIKSNDKLRSRTVTFEVVI